MKKTVQVLLAAFNGEIYLSQQLDSILEQRDVEVSILIRDDGSTDRTGRILDSYTKKYPNICVYTGEKKGASDSFYDLLAHADPKADYYAFADQDDVWMEEKLMRAVLLLEKEKSIKKGAKDLPLLYAGNVTCASKDLKRQEAFAYRNRKKASFRNALVENICMGCTQVFNRHLCILAKEHLPGRDVMHDWWMYLTASYFGRVIYDSQSYILYRQHGKNQVGMRNRWSARWINRLRNAGQMQDKLSGQAVEFRNVYKKQLYEKKGMDVRKNAAALELLCAYKTSRKKKIQLVCSRAVYRQYVLDDIACRVLFLTGYL